jgi:Fe2+ transport system protein FeoA
LPGLSASQRAHLQAYGLAPGCRLRVLRHKPVTIVLIDHLELALETQLAGSIAVSLLD